MPAGPSISMAEIAGLASQVLKGLAHVHSCGVLHKGLVPHHILVSADAVLKWSELELVYMHCDIMHLSLAPCSINNQCCNDRLIHKSGLTIF